MRSLSTERIARCCAARNALAPSRAGYGRRS
jgi:hypothetical protein